MIFFILSKNSYFLLRDFPATVKKRPQNPSNPSLTPKRRRPPPRARESTFDVVSFFQTAFDFTPLFRLERQLPRLAVRNAEEFVRRFVVGNPFVFGVPLEPQPRFQRDIR